MQRPCPSCGRLVSPDDGGVCRACRSAGVDPSRPAAQRRPRRKVPRPRHFSVRDDENSLRIRYCWVWRKFTGPASMCLAWNTFVVTWYWLALRAEERSWTWVAGIFGLPHLAVGLLVVYATLAGLLNRTVIRVTRESVRVWNGPLPWCRNRTLPADQLEGLSCEKGRDAEDDRERSDYVVNARLKGGSQVELVSELYDPAQARFLRQELERWLKIGEREIR